MCQKRFFDVKLFVVMRYISGAETGPITERYINVAKNK
jgi:hypothetical protein